MKHEYRKLFHCTYSLKYHLVIATKYRKKCLNKMMLADLEATFRRLLEMNEGTLLEFNGEDDHVHLLIELPPKVTISKAVNNMKTVSSRLLRRDHALSLKKHLWKGGLWSRSYFISSCGGAPLAVLKKYIQEQEAPH